MSSSDSERLHYTDNSFRVFFELLHVLAASSDGEDEPEPEEYEHPQINRKLVDQVVEEYKENYEPEEEVDSYQNCSIVKADDTFHCEICGDCIKEYIYCKNCEHKLCRSCLINYTIHNDDKTVCPFCSINFNYQFAEDHVLNNVLCKKKQCILCYDWCETDMVCCDNCHQYYCLSCFMRLLKNTSDQYSLWKRYPCAYCREEFSKTFIWVNTPECFHDDYFHSSLHQETIDKYYKNRERKRLNEQERKRKREREENHIRRLNLTGYEIEGHKQQIRDKTLICCKKCGIKFEYGVLKVYFKAIFEKVQKISGKSLNFKLFCPHCKEEWLDIDIYDIFYDDGFTETIHLDTNDDVCCCICRNPSNKVELDYIDDNICKKCIGLICEECLKKIIQGQICKCKCCNHFIINRFKDYYLCECGGIVSRKDYFCPHCKKINFTSCLQLIQYQLIQYKETQLLDQKPLFKYDLFVKKSTRGRGKNKGLNRKYY